MRVFRLPILRLARPIFLAALCLALSGCAASGPGPAPAVALAVDGPPLALAGEYAGMPLRGSMDRTCMTGYGSLRLEAESGGPEFICEARIDEPPTEKGRVRGVMLCTGERRLVFSLRNIGPDQGVGVGREAPRGDLLILFYHASPDEAVRRFPAVKDDILAAGAGKQ